MHDLVIEQGTVVIKLKKFLRSLIIPSILIGLIIYSGVNAMRGSRGLRAQAADRALYVKALALQARITHEQLYWQTRVDAMRDHQIDADMLNQRSRAVLNLANPHDLVVPLHEPSRDSAR